MKKVIKLFIAIAFFINCTAVFSSEYYFCDTGDDNNPGTVDKPMQTYAKATTLFNTMLPGSSINFCRGGQFVVDSTPRFYNSSCHKDAVCEIKDYGDSNKPMPVILSLNGSSPFNFEDGGPSNADGGYVVRNISLISSGGGVGVRLSNEVNDTLIDNVYIDGFDIGVYFAGANKPANKLSNGSNDRIKLINSRIINSSKIGFLGTCNDCLIEKNTFERNGSHGILDHNIYLSSASKASTGITIRDNFLYKSSIVDGKCNGVSLVAHGVFHDLVITNNTVKEDAGKVSLACWGISVDTGYQQYEEYFKNVKITNNTLINVGGTAIGCASCDGLEITGNKIIDEGGILITGISVPVRDEDSFKSSNVLIRNNKIVSTTPKFSGIKIGGDNPYEVSNNQIWQPENTTVECIIRKLVNTNTDISQNDCEYHNGLKLDKLLVDTVEIIHVADEGNLDSYSIKNESDNATYNQPETIIDTKPSRLTNKTIDIEANTEQNAHAPTGGGSSHSSSPSSSGTSSGRNINIPKDETTTKLSNDTSEKSRFTSPLSTTVIQEDSKSLDNTPTPTNAVKENVRKPSSIRSITIKDVIDASREDYKEVNASTCRAYSRDVCLMR
ncbi:right-handed parallel beta-helix repeat-containing protein [Methylophaga sulfidovorans]|uniref:Right handed beta helix region n=1 Tax=Methylophaga sulfidovorans TaxID=45496 RepID=A0A1I3XMA9_9GAMM|nr:right-handed parallel beta-helix repeat-containing protein [Methylophaga sulfidovorans]SFK20694.1 Right handed beta helix region [Methylophaga sulfidovorans]